MILFGIIEFLMVFGSMELTDGLILHNTVYLIIGIASLIIALSCLAVLYFKIPEAAQQWAIQKWIQTGIDREKAEYCAKLALHYTLLHLLISGIFASVTFSGLSAILYGYFRKITQLFHIGIALFTSGLALLLAFELYISKRYLDEPFREKCEDICK